MSQAPNEKVTQPEVDRIVVRMADWLERTPGDSSRKLAFSLEDIQWLLAEIEGGRESFGALVQANAYLRNEVARLSQTIGCYADLLAAKKRQ